VNGDELDDLIDQGMRAYVAREPAFGLDARVLRRVHRRDWKLRAIWAVAACGLVGIFAARTWQRPVEKLAITPVPARIEVPPITRVRAVHREPRFTAGERALLQFVQEHPEQALEAFARPENPVTVDGIEIPPVAIEPLDPVEENKR
jgi:hypothetical protein